MAKDIFACLFRQQMNLNDGNLPIFRIYDVLEYFLKDFTIAELLRMRTVCKAWRDAIDDYLSTFRSIKIMGDRKDLLHLFKFVSEIELSMDLDTAELLRSNNNIFTSERRLSSKGFNEFLVRTFPNVRRFYFYFSAPDSAIEARKNIYCVDLIYLASNWPALRLMVLSNTSFKPEFLQSLSASMFIQKMAIHDPKRSWVTFERRYRCSQQLTHLHVPADKFLDLGDYKRNLMHLGLNTAVNLELLSEFKGLVSIFLAPPLFLELFQVFKNKQLPVTYNRLEMSLFFYVRVCYHSFMPSITNDLLLFSPRITERHYSRTHVESNTVLDFSS